jgi:hypothetical protein
VEGAAIPAATAIDDVAGGGHRDRPPEVVEDPDPHALILPTRRMTVW